MAKTPSYRLYKRTGKGIVTINGRDIYLPGKHNSDESLAEYHRLIAEYKASNFSPAYNVPKESISIQELLAEFILHAKGYYGAESTEYDSFKRVIRPLAKLYGHTRAADFNQRSFKALREDWLSDPTRSRQYINKQMKRTLRIFKWAVSESLISAEVHHALSCVEPLKYRRCTAPETDPVKPVATELVDQTLPHLSRIVGDMVRFQLLTGCRPGEVCALTPGCIDRSDDSVWIATLDHHKTAHHGKARRIMIGPKAQDVIRSYLLRPSNAPCFSPKEADQERRRQLTEKRVTPASCGNRPGTNRKRTPLKSPGDSYTTSSYSKAIAKACRDAFPMQSDLTVTDKEDWKEQYYWSPNQLRHTYATLIRKQYGLEAASCLLGHSSVEVTQVYAERDIQRAMQIAAQVG